MHAAASAIAALAAIDVRIDGDSVTGFQRNMSAGLRHDAAQFVAEHDRRTDLRRSGPAVVYLLIGAANAACLHLDFDFVRPRLFHSHVHHPHLLHACQHNGFHVRLSFPDSPSPFGYTITFSERTLSISAFSIAAPVSASANRSVRIASKSAIPDDKKRMPSGYVFS